MPTYRTAESVAAGHPDKLCDQIADAVFDLIHNDDADARVACEVCATAERLIIFGEVTTVANYRPLLLSTVNDVCDEIGADRFPVDVLLNTQSPDIAQSLNDGECAGDQGIVYGYACRSDGALGPVGLPFEFAAASALMVRLRTIQREFHVGPDGKAQVTCAYDADGQRTGIHTIVLSAQHRPEIEQQALEAILRDEVVDAVLAEYLLPDTKVFINPSGRFVLGGPKADSGLTGRKLMVDSYGGLARHGGGSFSGKDLTKLDRLGAYYARYAANNLCHALGLDEIEIAVAYSIGRVEPIGLNVTCVPASQQWKAKRVLQESGLFDFRPLAMRQSLFGHAEAKAWMAEQGFFSTARFGHFGWQDGRPWESLRLVDPIKQWLSSN